MRLRLPSNMVLAGFVTVVRLGMGAMFIASSLPKICQPYDFLSSVYHYELVGPQLGLLVAMTLPWLELLVGICLVGGIWTGGGTARQCRYGHNVHNRGGLGIVSTFGHQLRLL